jgi:inosine-uridine nucleoside N-ribohydrolase
MIPARGRFAAVSILLLLVGCAHRSVAPVPSAAPLLVDVDMGLDDARVLVALPMQDRYEVVAVVSVEGSAGAARGAENALRLLAAVGADRIPVAVGARAALRGPISPPAWRQRTEELGGLALPAARRRVETIPGAALIASVLRRATAPVHVLALGPLTNLAEALAGDPSLVRRIHTLYLLGDFQRCDGYNCIIDRDAARAVLATGVPTVMVVSSATDAAPFDDALLAQIRRLRGRAAQLVARFMAGHPTGPMKLWDDAVLAGLIDPRVWIFGPPSGNVRRVVSLDVPRLRRVLLELWGRSSSARIVGPSR